MHLDISANSNALAIWLSQWRDGNKRYVLVYGWDSVTSGWQLLEQPIIGKEAIGPSLNITVSLSADGTKLAFWSP